tara:strand:- start:621 stop:758 length:138 start_codon:yes stop_codon:yes gene_type:complete
MKRVTNKQVIEKIEVIEKKLSSDEINKIHKNVSEIKNKLNKYRSF